jgi:hypothetical protein
MTLRRDAIPKPMHRDERVYDPRWVRNSYSIALQGRQRSDTVELTDIRCLSCPRME